MQLFASWFSKATPARLLLLSIAVGAGGAFGAALFHLLIAGSVTLFFGAAHNDGFMAHVVSLPVWQRLLIPTLGGLLIGVIFKLVKVSEAEGEGVPEVMEALADERGTIRPIVAPVKILVSAITLGSGGSAGREGPVIHIGSAIGSWVAQWSKLDQANRRTLLTAGAAAAIGGTFGAPAAGVIFAFELLKQRFSLLNTLIVVTAASIGALGMRLLTGYHGLRFDVTTSIELSITIILGALALGLIAGGIALGFGLVLRSSGTLFKRVPLPPLIRPAVGGFLIGCIGLYLPHIHEPAAYPLMVDILTLASLPISFLILLMVAKMLATGVTLGSGGSGGIFAPTLFIGTVAGGAFSAILISLGLTTTASTATFVLVGMAAVFAGAAHAPLTSIFILYEITGEFMLVPSLIIACFTSYLLARTLHRKSVYTEYADEGN